MMYKNQKAGPRNIWRKLMELTGKKVLILVETTYNDLEFWYPYYRLKAAGAEVIVVGPHGRTCIYRQGRTSN